MILEFHRRSDGAPLLVNMDYVVAIFEGRYGKMEGTILRLADATYEVRESLADIRARLDGKQEA